jgi:hypothetical protein
MERLGVGPPWNSSASAHAGRFSLSEVLEASPTIARRMQHQLSLSSELPWVQTRVEARQTAYEGGPKWGSSQGLCKKPRQVGRMANIDQAASGLALFCNQSRLIWPLNSLRTWIPEECASAAGTDEGERDG